MSSLPLFADANAKHKPQWQMLSYEITPIKARVKVREGGIEREIEVVRTDAVRFTCRFQNVSKSDWQYIFKIIIRKRTSFPAANAPILGTKEYQTATLKPGEVCIVDAEVPMTSIEKIGEAGLFNMFAQ